MNSDRHTQVRIILGTGTEYAVIILGALKALQLLGKLLAWCVEGMDDKIIALSMAGIILLILTAIMYDHANAADDCEDEFYKKFGGNENEEI